MATEAHGEVTSAEYIQHHLTNLVCGKTESHGWTCDPHYANEMGFWAFHVDSWGWSVFLGFLFIGLFRFGIPKISTEAARGIQYFVEMCIEFVNDNVQSIFTSAKNNLIGPMALTVLVWVFLMNLIFVTIRMVQFFLFSLKLYQSQNNLGQLIGKILL